VLSSVLFLLGCKQKKDDRFVLPYYNEPSFSPIFMKGNEDVKLKINHTINDFTFLNEDSILINQKLIEGKIHIANFIFTSCGSICPTMTKNLKIVSDSLSNNKNLVLLSFSVTPWIDQPHVLKRYKKQNKIENKNWYFLTGNKGDIYKLARQSYFAEEDIGFSKDSTEFLHTEHFVLVDKTKRIRGIYNGTLTLDMKQLINDFKTLDAEK
jgi:protein SCO1/2